MYQYLACSANGTVIASARYCGGIYVSTNAGATWTQTSAPSMCWASIDMSADGMVLFAIAASNDYGQPGNIYLYASHDGGVTWVHSTAGGSYTYTSLAMSSNASLIAVAITMAEVTATLGRPRRSQICTRIDGRPSA